MPKNGLQAFIFGRDATYAEVILPLATGAVGAGLALFLTATSNNQLQWWQWLLVAVIAFDIAGGVTANSTVAASREHHTGKRWKPVGFAAAHIQPFVLAILVPGYALTLAALTWVAAVLGASIVILTPHHLKRAVSLAYCAIVIGALQPHGLEPEVAWLAPMFLLKLVAAHAVPAAEERLSRRELNQT